MLMFLGVTTIALGAVLTAAAAVIVRKTSLAAPIRHFFGGPVFGVTAASLMGLGLVMVYGFIVDGQSASVVLPALAALGVAVVAYLAIRLFGRMAGTLPSLDVDDAPTAAAGRPRRAA